MKKYAVLFILFFIILLFLNIGANASVDFYIGDQLVDLPRPLMVVNGNILVPATILEDYLLAQIDYDWEAQQIGIEFATGQNISMVVGTRQVLVNGVEQLLDVEPEIDEGQIMIPLRFITDLLDFELKFDNKRVALMVVLTPDMLDFLAATVDVGVSFELPSFFDPTTVDDLLGRPQLKDIVYMGGPRSRVFLDIQGHAAYDSFLLTDPDRLIIDVHAEGQLMPTQIVEDAIINTISNSFLDNRTIRVIFDLNKVTNYQIIPWPQGGLDIKFNYQIGEIGYYRDEEDIFRLWFEANEQPSFQKLLLHSPMRLILDFSDSTLMDGAKELFIDDPAIKAIRINQYKPSITRLIFELNKYIEPVEVTYEKDRFEIKLFEGTLEEYQKILDEKQDLIDEIDETVVEHPIDIEDILKERIIVIDPGHGGLDPGTIGVGGAFEKDIVLAIGVQLGQRLEAAGALVVYTRKDDSYLSKFDRPKIADLVDAELFVSVHANYFDIQTVEGFETLYNPLYLENFRLAQTIQSELAKFLKGNSRGVRPRTDLAVLNNLSIPAALVEVGFLSNVEEELLLTSAEYQSQIVEGIFEGIQLFFVNYRQR